MILLSPHSVQVTAVAATTAALAATTADNPAAHGGVSILSVLFHSCLVGIQLHIGLCQEATFIESLVKSQFSLIYEQKLKVSRWNSFLLLKNREARDGSMRTIGGRWDLKSLLATSLCQGSQGRPSSDE